MEKKVYFKQIQKNEEIHAMIEKGNEILKTLGYTEHSVKHASKVSAVAADLLTKLEYDKHTAQLARIAGYMHDIGNCINRHDHAQSGAILAYQILKEMQMPLDDILTIAAAIGNHDEHTGTAVDAVSAAVILADKTDVRRNRVQNPVLSDFDAHDRVNYAVLSSGLELRKDKKIIQMNMELDDSMCSVMDYFEIFLERMMMCRKAADVLGCKFKLVANGSKLC